MSASNVAETNVLKLILQNVSWANIGDATGLVGSTVAGVLYVGLHTADPGEGGGQNTSEASYTSYARVSVARTTGGWAVTSGVGSNVGAVNFPACTGSTNTLTYFSIGTDSTGAGNLLLSGALTASLAVSSGITPSFAAGALTITAD